MILEIRDKETDRTYFSLETLGHFDHDKDDGYRWDIRSHENLKNIYIKLKSCEDSELLDKFEHVIIEKLLQDFRGWFYEQYLGGKPNNWFEKVINCEAKIANDDIKARVKDIAKYIDCYVYED